MQPMIDHLVNNSDLNNYDFNSIKTRSTFMPMSSGQQNLKHDSIDSETIENNIKQEKTSNKYYSGNSIDENERVKMKFK